MFRSGTLCMLATCSFDHVVTGTPQPLWDQTSKKERWQFFH